MLLSVSFFFGKTRQLNNVRRSVHINFAYICTHAVHRILCLLINRWSGMEYLFIADESLKLSGVQIQDFFLKKKSETFRTVYLFIY